ncbi:uncharacterized protein EV422DRAFT_563467 [Fimicolochytrium jonesii]|uniref:uncharacterized protein n=1 Tax=Fimicolochytrium jonesii TaxID=1396493 RepID=UPI0022FF0E58|nr:uncharacterized protein EV422DRAFT_563467 [Fimicolochytrium jonesii]KAI8825637.1 hypothetical protein EV422DRAFT_563467 [Fimicolochytrium jonesii]
MAFPMPYQNIPKDVRDTTKAKLPPALLPSRRATEDSLSGSESSPGRKSSAASKLPPNISREETDSSWHEDAPFLPFLDEVRAAGERGRSHSSSSSEEDLTLQRSRSRSDRIRGLRRLKEIVNASVESLALTGDDSAEYDPLSRLPFASLRDNAEFHRLYPDIDERDRLVNDFACAWNKDGLLIQGRMYISQDHVCFKGWTSSSVFSLPFLQISRIEKRTIALVFSNSIEIEMPDGKYFFASFFNRDQTFRVLQQLWEANMTPCSCDGIGTCATCFKRATITNRPRRGDSPSMTSLDLRRGPVSGDLVSDGSSNYSNSLNTMVDQRLQPEGEDNVDEMAIPTPPKTPNPGARSDAKRSPHPAECGCGADRDKLRKLLDVVYPVPIEEVWREYYTTGNSQDGGWYASFLADKRKAREIAVGPWAAQGVTSTVKPIPSSSASDPTFTPALPTIQTGAHRTLEYVLPLSGPIGPKQTRCQVTEEVIGASTSNDFVCVSSKAVTPDVPSGTSFHVITRVCLLHVPPAQTRMIVTTDIVFTKSCWIKAAIERATPEMQQRFFNDVHASLSEKFAKKQTTPPESTTTRELQNTARARPTNPRRNTQKDRSATTPTPDTLKTTIPTPSKPVNLAIGTRWLQAAPIPIVLLMLLFAFVALFSLTIQSIALYKVIGVLERVEERMTERMMRGAL